MGAVDEVFVPVVGHGGMAAPRPVDVHVANVRQVDLRRGLVLELVDVPAVGMVDVAVVDEVQVVLVREDGVSAQPVVGVRMVAGGPVEDRVRHEVSGPR